MIAKIFKLGQFCMLLGTATAAVTSSKVVKVSSTTVVKSSTLATASAEPTGTNYRITFLNHSEEDGDYAFFVQPPAVSDDPGDQLWTNIWIAERVVNNETLVITTSDTFYAWVGKAPVSPAPGVTIQGGVAMPAQLGTNDTKGSTFTMFNDGGTPQLKSAPTNSADAGAFEIDTLSDFTPDNLFMLGLAAFDAISNTTLPVAVLSALPNLNTQIFPVVKFYLAQGEYSAGEIIDYSSVSHTAGVIDFSTKPGLGNFGCTITQNPNGSFTSVYSPT